MINSILFSHWKQKTRGNKIILIWTRNFDKFWFWISYHNRHKNYKKSTIHTNIPFNLIMPAADNRSPTRVSTYNSPDQRVILHTATHTHTFNSPRTNAFLSRFLDCFFLLFYIIFRLYFLRMLWSNKFCKILQRCVSVGAINQASNNTNILAAAAQVFISSKSKRNSIELTCYLVCCIISRYVRADIRHQFIIIIF